VGRRGGIPEGGLVTPSPVTAVSDREFAEYQRLINEEAGIWLAPVKKALLVGRLARRLRELGLQSYGEYFERVVADEGEKVRMLDAICTNETHFFREPRHFEFLEERVFPAWKAEGEAGRRPRRVRIWSAACSTGDEPYTLAMCLLAAFGQTGWELEVVATDLSTKVLARAEAAVWPLDKAKEIPEAYLKAYMLKGFGEQEGLMKAGPEIRKLVRFARQNLTHDVGHLGSFDVVFCRNVLIYFDRENKGKVVEKLIDRLLPSGYLFLGHAESLGGFTTRARAVLPTVYTLAAPGAART
jgi:chemotaxis protein methyltransferase CheR